MAELNLHEDGFTERSKSGQEFVKKLQMSESPCSIVDAIDKEDKIDVPDHPTPCNVETKTIDRNPNHVERYDAKNKRLQVLRLEKSKKNRSKKPDLKKINKNDTSKNDARKKQRVEKCVADCENQLIPTWVPGYYSGAESFASSSTVIKCNQTNIRNIFKKLKAMKNRMMLSSQNEEGKTEDYGSLGSESDSSEIESSICQKDPYIIKNRIIKIRDLRDAGVDHSYLLESILELLQDMEDKELDNFDFISLYFIIISIQLDICETFTHPKPENLKCLLKIYETTIRLLLESPENIYVDTFTGIFENFAKQPLNVKEDIIQYTLRIQEEFYRTMDLSQRFSDNHSICVNNAAYFGKLVSMLVTWMEGKYDIKRILEIYMIRILQEYTVFNQTYLMAFQKNRTTKIVAYSFDSLDWFLFNELCLYVAERGDIRQIVRSKLCAVYYQGMHGRWSQAYKQFKDVMKLISFEKYDAPTRVLYYRAKAQLGLSSFINGSYGYSLYYLHDLMNNDRTKVLLGQEFDTEVDSELKEHGFSRYSYLQPSYLHINIELLKCVYCITTIFCDRSRCLPTVRRKISDIRDEAFATLNKLENKRSEEQFRASFLDHIYYAYNDLNNNNLSSAIIRLQELKCWDILFDKKLAMRNLQIRVVAHYTIMNSPSLHRLSETRRPLRFIEFGENHTEDSDTDNENNRKFSKLSSSSNSEDSQADDNPAYAKYFEPSYPQNRNLLPEELSEFTLHELGYIQKCLAAQETRTNQSYGWTNYPLQRWI